MHDHPVDCIFLYTSVSVLDWSAPGCSIMPIPSRSVMIVHGEMKVNLGKGWSGKMIRYLLHYTSAVPDVGKGKLAYNIRSLQLMLFLCYILCFNSVLFYFWHCTFFLTQKIVISCCYCYYIYAATVVTSLFLLQYVYIPMKVYVQHKTHNTHTNICNDNNTRHHSRKNEMFDGIPI